MLGFGQDVYAGSDSVLRKQVQNYAAHGMVGTFFSLTRHWFLATLLR